MTISIFYLIDPNISTEYIYIRKDILLKIYEHGEINQSKLMSYCSMSNVKNKEILDSMVEKGLIKRNE
jgi:DNA-binding MarR family transcriptional regulator